MRQRYIVSYDICDDIRLRKVAKIMEGYGQRVQYSVFQCDVSRMNLVKLKGELEKVVHFREDQVLFIDIGPAETPRVVIKAVGKPYLAQAPECLVL